MLKIRDNRFVERKFDIFSRLVFASTSKSHIIEAIESWQFFDPKSRDITPLKRHFLIKLSTDFPKILCECARLMLYMLPQVPRRYLHSYLSYWESSLGVALYASQPTNTFLAGYYQGTILRVPQSFS